MLSTIFDDFLPPYVALHIRRFLPRPIFLPFVNIKITYILWRYLKGFDYYLDNAEPNFKITRAFAEKEVNKVRAVSNQVT